MASSFYIFRVNDVLIRNCRSKGDHSDSDWMHLMVTINDQVQEPAGLFNIGDNIHAGDELHGPWEVGPYLIGDEDKVTVTLVVTNLSHTDRAEQIGEAIKIGTLIVAAVGGVASAVASALEDQADAILNAALAGVIGTAGEVLGWIVGTSDPNCDGEVLSQPFFFDRGELARRAPFTVTNDYTSRSPSECGNDPHTRLSLVVLPAQSAWRFCQKCHAMFFDGYPDKGVCRAGGGHAAAGFDFVLSHDAPESEHEQADWRFCQKCHAVFFDGYPDKGSCPAGGGHAAAGFHFMLPHEVTETGQAQASWRFCQSCHVMFFDGSADKGLCPGPSGHEAAGFNFVLTHDTNETGQAQASWRFCQKCNGMFFDGRPDKGHCPAGAGHVAAGYNFVLAHDTSETGQAQAHWRFCLKCNGMFFDGRPDKGSCPAGAGHVAAGFDFVLAHDTNETVHAQANWRFCRKCNGMFFDGRPDKGVCPGPSGHVARGFNFVLNHRG